MLTLKTPAAVAAVSDEEVISHLRLDVGAWEAQADLRGKVLAAVSDVENATGRQLINATWQLILPCFPDEGVLCLPRPPLQTFGSVIYKDVAGITQTMAPADYTVLKPVGDRVLPGSIVLNADKCWPDTYTAIDAVTIEWTAGYGAASTNIPSFLRAVVLLRLGELYESRQGPGTLDLAKILAGWRVYG
jgi:uncharacterized phiE125 gp8 family phage protein